MFYAMWLVCLSVTNNCEEIVRTVHTFHKTEEACMVDARETAQEIHMYFIQHGVQAQIGVKCVEDNKFI